MNVVCIEILRFRFGGYFRAVIEINVGHAEIFGYLLDSVVIGNEALVMLRWLSMEHRANVNIGIGIARFDLMNHRCVRGGEER